jgi:hypothetical protein
MFCDLLFADSLVVESDGFHVVGVDKTLAHHLCSHPFLAVR